MTYDRKVTDKKYENSRKGEERRKRYLKKPETKKQKKQNANEYYYKNREKLIETQKKWNKKHYKPVPDSNPFKARAIKAWKTRRKKNEVLERQER